MTERHEPGDCCADLHRKLDRILELLEDRRKPPAAQAAIDLIQKYEQGIISGTVFRARMTKMTGILHQNAHDQHKHETE